MKDKSEKANKADAGAVNLAALGEIPAATEAEVERLRAAVAKIDSWTHEYGAALCPHGPDTYGEGMRVAKAEVRRLLAAAGEVQS